MKFLVIGASLAIFAQSSRLLQSLGLCGAGTVQQGQQAYNCDCLPGYTRVTNWQCKDCSNGWYNSSTGQCSCNWGYQLDINGKCVTSSPSTVTCGSGQQLKPWGTCECKDGYSWVSDTQCIDCTNGWYNSTSGTCQCNYNYNLDNNGKCVLKPYCTNKQNPATDNCICNLSSGNFVMYDGVLCYRKCTDHSYWDGSKCACQTNYHKVSGKCVLN